MQVERKHRPWGLSALVIAVLVGLAGCGAESMKGGDNPGIVTACPQVSRFDSADFPHASIEKNSLGGITARFAIGIDQVGNLSTDGKGNLNYEQHVVSVGGPHPLLPLPPADRESLAANTKRYLLSQNPASVSLWQQLLGEALPPWAQASGLDTTDLQQAAVQTDQQGDIALMLVLGVDVVGNLRADAQGNVTYEQHVVSQPGQHQLLPLLPMDTGMLAAHIQQFLGTHVYRASLNGADIVLWQQLLGDLRSGLAQASRFDSIDFRRAAIQSGGNNDLLVRFAIGVDVVGNLHAGAQGDITYEQHGVSDMGPHPQQGLSPEDRESLLVNVQRYLFSTQPAVAPLWDELLTDSTKC
jgi:hypothetical protein